MIPIISDVATSPSTALETVKMSMDRSEESVLIAMRSMENNYTDSSGATVREYATNALDAHVEAGVTRPIEITTPTNENPIYIVQDFGCGMSREFLTKNFSLYRFSTKRNNNKANGIYGLGSKSALSEVNAFTIESVCEGYKTIARIYKTEDGSNISILAHDKTDKPSGTRVTINIGEYKVEEYKTKIKEFFFVWKHGTVLIDGEAPQTIHDDVYTRIGKFGYIKTEVEYGEFRGLRILQGNVLYPVNSLTYEQSKKLFAPLPKLTRMDVVLEVPNGSLSYTDSREGIVNSSENLAKIARHIEMMSKFMEKDFVKRVEAESDLWEQLRIVETYNRIFNSSFNEKLSDDTRNNLEYKFVSNNGYVLNEQHKIEQVFYPQSVIPSTKYLSNKCLVWIKESETDEEREKSNSRARRALKSYILNTKETAKFRNFQIAVVNQEKYEELRKLPMFKAMVDHEQIDVKTSQNLADWHKEYRAIRRAEKLAENGGQKKSDANVGGRGSLTYPMRFHGDDAPKMESFTLNQLKEKSTQIVYVYQPTNSYNSYESSIRSAFDSFSVEGEALVILATSRSYDVLERKLSKNYEVVNASKYFFPKIAQKFIPYDDEMLFLEQVKNRRVFNDFFEKMMQTDLVETVKSPLLKKIMQKTPEFLKAQSNNKAVNSLLPYAYQQMNDNHANSEVVNKNNIADSLDKLKNHYGVLRVILSSYLNPNDLDEVVDLLNAHYEKNGDPDIVFGNSK